MACTTVQKHLGAKGREVVVSGKLRAACAKSMKVTDGFVIHSGQPARDFIDYAVRHVLLHQGVLGIKVKLWALHAATTCIGDCGDLGADFMTNRSTS